MSGHRGGSTDLAEDDHQEQDRGGRWPPHQPSEGAHGKPTGRNEAAADPELGPPA